MFKPVNWKHSLFDIQLNTDMYTRFTFQIIGASISQEIEDI